MGLLSDLVSICNFPISCLSYFPYFMLGSNAFQLIADTYADNTICLFLVPQFHT